VVPHSEFVVIESSQVGAARRHAATLCDQLKFDEVSAGRVAIIVTELGNNLVRYANDGRLLLSVARWKERSLLEVISLDRGPGMQDTDRCLTDGYSTGGTQGSGLGAVRRLADDFDIFSRREVGTVVMARVAGDSSSSAVRAASRASSALSVAGVCLPAPTESVSGDCWASIGNDERARLILADGLGHGPEAATAADAAVSVFNGHPEASLAELLEKAHLALQGTRGAAAAVVAIDGVQNNITICGAGNIVGRIISGTEDRSLVTDHGTLGLQMRRFHSITYPWVEHAVLIFHSDGIATRWNLKEVPRLLQCSPAVIAAWILHQHRRGRDDATVIVARRG
jgi:anti-sigma regulatory factor (Ser/Thr protein kinase)